MQPIDLTQVTTYPIAQRPNLVTLASLIDPAAPAPDFASAELDAVVDAIVSAHQAGRPVIWMMGAHVIKSGLSRLVIDLMARGIITHVAGNGAVSIHGFELALMGETSEDVATSLEDGTFGMADETGRYMFQALRQGARDGLGYGASIGRFIDRRPERFPHREVNVLWNAYRLSIPATIHATVGTDIIHQHPTADFTVLGATSGRDFLTFAGSVAELEGGIFLNFGSAVTGPEVFLKSLTIARNLGHTVSHITTANFDLIPLGDDYHVKLGYDQPLYYYRPRKNIINRPVSLGGAGYHITGDHRETLPNLHHRIVKALAGGPSPLRQISSVVAPEMPAPLSGSRHQDGHGPPTQSGLTPARAEGPAGAILDDLVSRHPELGAITDDLARAFRELVRCHKAGGTLYLCGNGGSMADALHISGELLKSYAHPRPLPENLKRRLRDQPDGELLIRNLEGGLRAVVLGANPSLVSAVANDRPDRDVNLAQELLALAHPGDVFLGISTSGNARNVTYAAQTARAIGVTTLGLTGSGGGRLADLADIIIRVPAQRTDRVQEQHVLCYHALCEMLEVTLFWITDFQD
jgi:phosphoheptose isomerase